MKEYSKERASGHRFEFGKNWSRFLTVINDERIAEAEESLKEMLEVEGLKGKNFLDVGSGSGLFSLVARRLGARVHSFDYDPHSVACTAELRRRYLTADADWVIEEGSVLDKDYLKSLGVFDIVYAWGVLHHTGAMWQALRNLVPLVKEGGKTFIAIYNDQGRHSRDWLIIKKAYNHLPRGFKFLVIWPSFIRLWGPTILRDFFQGRQFHTWQAYAQNRGMSPWRNVVDWVGGYPFEVAKPEDVFDFYKSMGFKLEKLKTCAGGHGCNEFVFEKIIRKEIA
jgi:2-polyprenyl-3-methyl-5-hydroxy-6-metoxy-1,4-benzoquinol methylase